MFKFIASKIWNGVKKAASWTWGRVVKPAARKVAKWLGIASEKTERVLEKVERTAAKVVRVLETDVGQLIAEALDVADAAFKRWLRASWGPLGHQLAVAIELLERRLGIRTESQVEFVEPIVLVPTEVKAQPVRPTVKVEG